MRWNEQHPVPRTKFGLSILSDVSGVDVLTIQRWQRTGALPGRRVGKGTPRAYTVWDALRLRCLAEMTKLGMRLTGPGLHLSAALAGLVRHQVALHGNIDHVPTALRLYPEDDTYLMAWDPRVTEPEGSHIAINLKAIAESVGRRFLPEDEDSIDPPALPPRGRL